MKNIAYRTTLLVVALFLTMFIYACDGARKSCPSDTKTPKPRRDQRTAQSTSVLSSISTIDSEHIGNVVSTRTSRVIRVLAPDTSFVVRGQLLYILDDAEIWSKIVLTNERLRSEMKKAKQYEAKINSSDNDIRGYLINRRTIQELNDLRNLLYRELSKTRIRAPFTGTLGVSKVKPGDTVYTGVVLNEIIKYDNHRQNCSNTRPIPAMM